MSFPYLDLKGFTARTVMPSGDVAIVEAAHTGFTAQRIAVASSYINARLRKRYGNAQNSYNSLPLGQTAPGLDKAGTTPPDVSLTGRPTLGSLQIILVIVAGGAVGTAQFKTSIDGGMTYGAVVSTAASVKLPVDSGYGLQVLFSPGAYSADDIYSAPTPVPETILGWIVALVTMDLYRKRGVNPQDPTIETVREEAIRALAELKEAADSKDGLFDLPVNENADSAITTGGPLGYAEQSPYTWTDIEQCLAGAEDTKLIPPGGGHIV
jgi:hypothetical protein